MKKNDEKMKISDYFVHTTQQLKEINVKGILD
jgi:hypothetical protein